MAFSLPLPRKLASQWKVKIRDRERLEPPHVTIIRAERSWRLNLRTGEFMDVWPEPGEVPEALQKWIFLNWQLLQRAWDAAYPENKVRCSEDPDE
ncbi:MAG: hypothetical protein FJ086_08135 [Deltaproteobacteria bacterium]|nr:hypothetical protein [Deltaproteobacteria bacterium]